MPAKPLTGAQKQQAVDLIAEHGGVVQAARVMGINSRTLDARYRRALDDGYVPGGVAEEEENPLAQVVERLRVENERLKMEVAQAVRPKFTVRQDTVKRSGTIRIVAIGDAHDSPHIPNKSRFEWIGNYIRKEKPDVVLQIGDFATLDSLNTHTPNHTYEARQKPTFTEDMESFNLALQAMDCGGAEKHVTLGNHERRIWLFEQNAPETFGMMQFELTKLLERYGWTFSPYGVQYMLGGIAFVHCGINKLGKSIGGLNAENTIANHSLHDTVIGHSHVFRHHTAPKLGNNKYIHVVNVGCALPQGYVESYAKHSQSGWTWGITDMVVQHGHIRDCNFISMETLEEKYSG